MELIDFILFLKTKFELQKSNKVLFFLVIPISLD